MELFLDTTIQIDRIFGSQKKKAAIRAACGDAACRCTSYVLGEFNATIMTDAVTVYNILLIEKDVNEAAKRVADVTRNRHESRSQLILIQLRELFDNNIEQMKCELESYFDLLLRMFYRGLSRELADETACQRAKARITYEDKVPALEGASCQKASCQCAIEDFWRKRQPLLASASLPPALNGKVKPLLTGIAADSYDVKGNHCRSLGDAVITAEAGALEGEVCSTNRRDFEPLCALLHVPLHVPDYSGIYQARRT